jgi:hypothetical protein
VYTFLVTGEESGGSMFALDCVVGVGGGRPRIGHLAEDELFLIYDGKTPELIERMLEAGSRHNVEWVA